MIKRSCMWLLCNAAKKKIKAAVLMVTRIWLSSSSRCECYKGQSQHGRQWDIVYSRERIWCKWAIPFQRISRRNISGPGLVIQYCSMLACALRSAYCRGQSPFIKVFTWFSISFNAQVDDPKLSQSLKPAPGKAGTTKELLDICKHEFKTKIHWTQLSRRAIRCKAGVCRVHSREDICSNDSK